VNKKISIFLRYCGGCNPEIDRRKLVCNLHGLASSQGVLLVFSDTIEDADMLLLVNGCPRACLEDEFSGPYAPIQSISIQGERVDRLHVPEKDLPRMIWDRFCVLMNG